MGGVQIGGHDPNAKDTSTADQTAISQIQGEQQQADQQALQQIEAAAVAVFDPSAEIAQQVQAAAATGHGYVFTPEQVDNLVTRAQDQRDKLQGYLQKIDPFKIMDLAPAEDQAGSVLHANALKTSYANLDQRITSQVAFLTDWINKLNGAKQNYMQQERLTEAQWKRLTQGLA